MRAQRKGKVAILSTTESHVSDLEDCSFVPVAIPAKIEQSLSLKADLEAYDIPAMLETEFETSPSPQLHAAVPVLVPQCQLELASEIAAFVELAALNDGDLDAIEEFDKDTDEFEDTDDDLDDEDWDDEDYDESDEDDEDEDELADMEEGDTLFFDEDS